MSPESIRRAEAAASEFIRRVAVLQAMEAALPDWEQYAAQGALRRMSMELTRALADMRKPGV